MVSVPKEHFIAVHGKAEIYVGSLTDRAAAEELPHPEPTDAEEGETSDGTMAVEANVIVIYVDGRAYEIDLDDPENAEALSPTGQNLTWLKGKLIDPSGVEEGLNFALGVSPAKLQQALTKGMPVPENLLTPGVALMAGGELGTQASQMMVQGKSLDPQKRKPEGGPALIDLISGEIGIKEDELTGKQRMHYRTDLMSTGFDTTTPAENKAQARGKGWTSYSLVEAGMGGHGAGINPVTATLTGSALAAVADIRGSAGHGFVTATATMNDVGSQVVNTGEAAAGVEQKRNQEFAKATPLPGSAT